MNAKPQQLKKLQIYKNRLQKKRKKENTIATIFDQLNRDE